MWVCRSGPHDPGIPDALTHYASGAAPLAARGHHFFQEIAFFFQDTRVAEVPKCHGLIDATRRECRSATTQTRRYGDYQTDIYLEGQQDIADLLLARVQRISLKVRKLAGVPFRSRYVQSHQSNGGHHEGT